MPISLTKSSDVDVLIIGAGPAGLMACNALAKAGINVRIIDQRPSKVAAGQADGIQPRTIEVLQSYGLAERLLKEANQVHIAAFYNPGADGGIELTDRISDVSNLTARYPFEATLHQGAIEAIFIDSIETMGIEVDRPVVPTSLEISEDERELKDPNAHPVRVTLKHTGPFEGQTDTEIVNAKFVVGADGAHSWVRKTLNIAMEGEQTQYIWGVIDMIPETNFPDIRNRTAIHSNNGSCMIIPREDDKVRLYIQLDGNDAIDVSSGRVDKGKLGPEYLLEVARKSFYPYTFETPKAFEWWTIYMIGQRVAASYSVHERVFIAGDACHTHSPKAGQGMNASMSDSHNLAWKLTHVMRGWADMSLLKTYESERRNFAQELIAFDKQFAKLFSGKPRTEANQDGISHEVFMKAFKAFGDFTSGIGIHYPESSLVNAKHQSCVTNLIIGQRMPPQIVIRAADAYPTEIQDILPADGRYKILLFPGDTSLPEQRAKLNKLAETLSDSDSFLGRAGSTAKISATYDILTISTAKKTVVKYNDIPEIFRSHWSKVLIDDTDIRGIRGGEAYKTYGINRTAGTVVIVRPDGYVGMIAPFDHIQDINLYFKSFMRSCSLHK